MQTRGLGLVCELPHEPVHEEAWGENAETDETELTRSLAQLFIDAIVRNSSTVVRRKIRREVLESDPAEQSSCRDTLELHTFLTPSISIRCRIDITIARDRAELPPLSREIPRQTFNLLRERVRSSGLQSLRSSFPFFYRFPFANILMRAAILDTAPSSATAFYSARKLN